MPRRGGGSYDKFRERLNQTQAQQQREEDRRERERKEQAEAQRLFEAEQAERDEHMRQSMLGMSPWQKEQVRMNDEGFMRYWGIRNRATTVVPSADDRLEAIRKEQEEVARQRDQERYEAQLQAQREALERQAQLQAAREAEYRDTMDRIAKIQAQIAIERWVQHPGDYL